MLKLPNCVYFLLHPSLELVDRHEPPVFWLQCSANVNIISILFSTSGQPPDHSLAGLSSSGFQIFLYTIWGIITQFTSILLFWNVRWTKMEEVDRDSSNSSSVKVENKIKTMFVFGGAKICHKKNNLNSCLELLLKRWSSQQFGFSCLRSLHDDCISWRIREKYN